MSYQKRKLKKSRFNQLKESIRLIKIVFQNLISWTTQKLKSKKEVGMLFQVTELVAQLRSRALLVRPNNLKVDIWVERYLRACLLLRKPVIILTQWCLAKDLELRFEKQGQKFFPTSGEKDLVFKEIPSLLDLFKKAGLRVSWLISFNRSYLDMGRVRPEIETQYLEMIKNLFTEAGLNQVLTLLNWEDDALGGRPKPSQEVLGNFFKTEENPSGFIKPRAFEIDLERHAPWAREIGMTNEEQIQQDVKFKIACEAEEGRLLCSKESPIALYGKFLLVPLEAPERIDFFSLLAKNFRRRLVPVLKINPWRLS